MCESSRIVILTAICSTSSLSDSFFFFFFNDTATTEIYTLSLHDALPISAGRGQRGGPVSAQSAARSLPGLAEPGPGRGRGDRKSTRLNSSHQIISYAVFCLKKKKERDTKVTIGG